MKDYWAATINGGTLGVTDFEHFTSDLLISGIANYYVDEYRESDSEENSGFPGLLMVYKSMVANDLVELDKSIIAAMEKDIIEEILQIESDIQAEKLHIKQESTF